MSPKSPRRLPVADRFVTMVRSLKGQPLPEQHGKGRVVKAPPVSDSDPVAEAWEAQHQQHQVQPNPKDPT
jgi:hypothetical protein